MSGEALDRFIREMTGEAHVRVEDDLGDGFVRLHSAEAERRQAKHDIRSSEDIVIELLRNSRDAGASHIFLATCREGERRSIIVIDDGCGIPREKWDKVFEARVTSKLDSMRMDTWGVHGRGMALYAVRENADAAYIAQSVLGEGTSLVVRTDVRRLPEKSDQSTQPVFSLTENGIVTVRGPKNICRTATEFAYIDRQAVSVSLGAPTEISAALWRHGRALLSPHELLQANPADLSPCTRLSACATSEEFVVVAAGLGLELSERSARRVMDGEIEPASYLADSIVVREASHSAGTQNTPTPVDDRGVRAAIDRTQFDARSLHIDASDLESLRAEMIRAFQPIASAYYLEPEPDIKMQVRKDGIHLSIPVQMIH